jgi:hypothetical protein
VEVHFEVFSMTFKSKSFCKKKKKKNIFAAKQQIMLFPFRHQWPILKKLFVRNLRR